MAPLNFHQALPEVATSGQPTPGELHDIADLGYEVVINLAMADSDNALPDEGSLVASLGRSYFNIPVPFEEPTVQHLRDFIGIMKVLDRRKVWVHCAVNARVSAFMFHYLTKIRNLDEDAATSPLLRRWQPQMDNAWQGFMEISTDELDN